ncbi:MAG TPA: efflux RND transporter periplasmic adaptor subunit, partial [Pyrinomonadaceae bacterium]|nr:efflux RND transporter periplasmic adaptor subunit [Pyrinomonadaceae bacterium]
WDLGPVCTNSRGLMEDEAVEEETQIKEESLDDDNSSASAEKKSFLTIGKIAAGIGVLVVAILVTAYFFVGRTKPAQAASQPIDVEVVAVEQHDVPLYSEWIGTTDGMINADIKAEVSGYLLRQDYKEGSFVEKGQLLFELDPRPFQAALDQANGQVAQYQGQLEAATAQVSQAEAQVAQAKSQILQAQAQVAQSEANETKTRLDANKYGPLFEQRAVTRQELDNAVQSNIVAKAQVAATKAGVETARAQLRAAEAQIRTANAAMSTAKGQIRNAQAAVRTAELNLGFTRVVSPISGIAGAAQAQVGNLITPTSSSLTTVSAVNPIKVYFSLNESDYLAFTKRKLITGRAGATTAAIELQLILSDGTEYPNKGSFYFADRQIDPKTGSIRLAGIFQNPDNVLRPGQYGRVRAITSRKQDALLVPQRAVSELQGSYQVAVVGAENKIEMRTVKVGDRSDSMWVVEDGLKVGESVVVEGVQKVKAGATVNPKPYTPPAQ